MIYAGPDRSFIVSSRLFFFLCGYRPVTCNLYRAGQVIYCDIRTFIVGYCKDLIEDILKEALLIIPLLGLQISPIRVLNWST